MTGQGKIGVIVVAAVVAATVGYALMSGGDGSTPQTTTNTLPNSTTSALPLTPTDSQTQDEPRKNVAPGRYTEFSANRQMQKGYTRTILFFYASWCPECRGFDQAIQSQQIPDGTQILQVNYDDSQQLKQQYGVTIQTTFVHVTSDGQFIRKWVGYGQKKSVDAVLQNVSG